MAISMEGGTWIACSRSLPMCFRIPVNILWFEREYLHVVFGVSHSGMGPYFCNVRIKTSLTSFQIVFYS